LYTVNGGGNLNTFIRPRKTDKHTGWSKKTDTQFYFWDNFGNSAPILTIHSFTVTSRNSWRVNAKFFHPPHLYCVTTLPSKTNITANIGVQCFVALAVFVLLGNVITQ